MPRKIAAKKTLSFLFILTLIVSFLFLSISVVSASRTPSSTPSEQSTLISLPSWDDVPSPGDIFDVVVEAILYPVELVIDAIIGLFGFVEALIWDIQSAIESSIPAQMAALALPVAGGIVFLGGFLLIYMIVWMVSDVIPFL